MSRSLLALVMLASLTAPAAAEMPDDNLYTCRALPSNAMVSVNIKPDVSLLDLATWVAGFTCKNVVYDSGVTKYATKLTVITPQKMTAKQALALFVDAVQATGLVVKQKPDSIIISLGPNMPRTCPDVAVASPPSRPSAPSAPPVEAPVPPAPPEPGITDAELDAGIKKAGENQVTMKRGLVDKVLANPMAIAKGARVVPAMKNGAPVGFKLYAIRKGSVYERLGFQNGDTLARINGMELTSADKALEVYTKLREATSLEMEVTRRGKPVTLKYTIR